MKLVFKSFLSLLALSSLLVFAACGSETGTESADATELNENPQAVSLEDAANAMQNNQTQAQEVPSGPSTVMTFKDGMVFDYGTIDAGTKVSHTFKFKNTGSEPLIISNCKGSCGCTVPKCPTEPIAPGQEGEIPVEFDSKGKNGPDTKTVTITANTNPGTTVLTIRGNVKGDASSPTIQMQ